jgi:LPXTG-site transpeptidase (sortase) family protein
MSVLDSGRLRAGFGNDADGRANPWPVILGILLVCFGAFGVAPELGELLIPPEEIPPAADLDVGFAPLLSPAGEAQSVLESGLMVSRSRRAVGSGETGGAEFLIPITGEQGGADNMEIRPGQAAPAPAGYVPQRLVIPAIDLDAPVERVSHVEVEVQDQVYRQWLAPDKYAAGWHENSARFGAPGNTVLNGHHNVAGEVFRDISELESGDQILLFNGAESRVYEVVAKMILKERYEPLDRRLENARWIHPTEDERLTLITCWPYTSNTHRVVVVATPMKIESPNPVGEPQLD